MVEQTFKRCTLKELRIERDDYVLDIYVPTRKVSEDSILFVNMIERYTEKEVTLAANEIERTDELILIQARIEKRQYEQLMNDNTFWDVYIISEQENDVDTEEDSDSEAPKITKFRVKSNQQYLELLYTHQKEIGKLWIPYATNKQNLSFKIKEPHIIARVEDAILDKNGILTLKGFAIDPLEKDVMLEKNLVLQDANHEFEKKYPVQTVERPDLAEQYGDGGKTYNFAGFTVQVNVIDLIERIDDKIRIKAYIEMPINGVPVLSSRLKYVIHHKPYAAQRYVKKVNQQKKRISLARTKKAKYLRLTVDDYSLIRSAKSLVRRKLIGFKKSKQIKKTYKLAFKIIGTLPAKKNVVMFESFLGKQYSDNPRAIYEYMKEHHPEFKLYWSIDKRFIHNFEGKDLIYINRFSIKWLFAMARARYWVTNSRMPLWIPKPKHTIYLQTWHGTPLKKLAADMDEVHMPGTTTSKYKRNFLKEASNWDYLISPNAYSTEIFRRAFQFEKEMLETGYPRNDVLYNENKKETIEAFKVKYGLPLDKKVILYAPTWRDNQFYGKGRYKFDLALDLTMLKERLGDEYIIVLRMHYLVAENFDLTPYTGFAYDFSNHEDIRELYLVADLLITDYSSVFFDYANLKRPMIFFVYDIDDYRDNLRGFYFDFEENAPGPLVKTTEQVIEEIRKLESNGFTLSETFNAFYNKFCYLESGHSSQKVVDRVFRGRKDI
ncbi:CDP-glycerol glycerophosphotransferase family protein [Heyndrickxia ginsengihumi]|uniref:CDP-glycerol glycerophosphotransferase family protein n=1 Tax=Heyndrickxia ginsengihumi TaxID=363870 RepID=UPI00046F833A|nr:CDP-glycerol glycerophosphotransferase family protein [Heyndrickxia ginsengihumi]